MISSGDLTGVLVASCRCCERAQKELLSGCALDYLQVLKNPEMKIRFDIVEVLLSDGAVREIRHLPNTFSLSKPYRYG